jgi:plastocyanin
MPVRRIALSLIVASAIAFGTAACGGSDTRDDPLTVGGMNETIVMEGTKFRTGNLQVPVGATVTWENRDSAPHDAAAEDDSWETETLEDGESGSVTFDEAGTWDYICTIHPSMKARITVAEPGAESTPADSGE